MGGSRDAVERVRVGSWAYALAGGLLAVALFLPLARFSAIERKVELRTSDLAVVWWWTLIAAIACAGCVVYFRHLRRWYTYLLPLAGALLGLVFVILLAQAASLLDRLASAAVGEEVAGARAETGLWLLGIAAVAGVVGSVWDLVAVARASRHRASSPVTATTPQLGSRDVTASSYKTPILDPHAQQAGSVAARGRSGSIIAGAPKRAGGATGPARAESSRATTADTPPGRARTR